MNKKLLIYYFFNLVWYRHPWSVIRDHGLVSTPLVCYQRPWSGIDTPGLLSETMVWYRHPWSIIGDHFFSWSVFGTGLKL